MTAAGPGARTGVLEAALVPAWLAFVWVMLVPAWHPVALASNMLPVIPGDVLAGVQRLYVAGLPALGMLCLAVLAALGAGALLLAPFRLDTPRPQRLTLSLGLGLAALSLFTFFLGIGGGYNHAGRVASIGVLSVMAAAGAVFLVRRGAGASPRRLDWHDYAFLALLGIVAVFLLAKATRPAVFYDAVTYHLGVPNYYLQEGGIGYIPYDSYSNFPFMAEMLYTLGMLVSGLKLAQFMSVAFYAACALLVYEFARENLPGLPPALPAALFLLTPAFMEMSLLYGNDLQLMYYSLLVLYCWFMLDSRGSCGWAALMGVFTGVCIGTKYTALASISLPALAAVCWTAWKRRTEGSGPAALVAAFALPALITASPWLIKNLAYTGNPFYPALFGILGGQDMTARYYALHQSAAAHPSFVEGLTGILPRLWNLFMAKPAYFTDRFDFASFAGPGIMLFAPLLVLSRNAGTVVRRLCIIAAAVYVVWCMMFPVTRFLYPAIILMVIVASHAIVVMYRRGGYAVKASVAAAAAACLVFSASLGFYQADSWTNAYGFEHADETDAEFIARRAGDGGTVMLQAAPVYEWINENAPQDARVLIIGDAQHLYIERRHLYAYLSAKNPYELFAEPGLGDEAAAARLKSMGVTHIVYNPDELRRLQRAGYTSFPESADARLEAFLKGPHVRLAAASRLHERQVFCFELI